MDAPPRRLSLPLHILTLSTRVLLWLIVLAWLVLGAAWAALHGFIVPRIGELRPQVQQWASQALGVPVRVGAIVAHADTLLPSFELIDVALHDAEGRVALHLPRVVATLSPRSLWRLGFEQLAIERPDLQVRRAADGRWFVAGVPITPSAQGDGRLADWVFSQTEWVITQGRVQWHDERAGTPPLALQQVDLRMHNGARLHELRLDATPPPELGSRFSLRARLRQPLLSTDAGAWHLWDGQFYAIFERAQLAELRRYLPLPLGEVHGGSGALRLWIDVAHARITGAAADLALADVGLRLAPQLPLLELARLQGRVAGRQKAQGFELATQQLRFDTVDGLRWHGGDVRVAYQQSGADAASGSGDIQLTDVDLQTVALLAQRLPLAQTVHEALLRYAPRGRLQQLQARWSGDWVAPARYEARGRLSGLEVSAEPLPALAPGAPVPWVMPGVRGLSADFDFNQDGGRATLLLQQGHVDLPSVFETARLPLERLSAEAQWQRRAGLWVVQLPSVRFANADAQGELQLKWQQQEDHGPVARRRLPGVLELQGSLSRAELAAVHRYLPWAVDAEVRHYLREAVIGGYAGNVRFRLRGDLHHFPFAHGEPGEFRVSASVQDARFRYVPAYLQPAGQPPWPAFTELSGELVIDRAELTLRGVRARLQGAPAVRLAQGEGRIPLTPGAQVQARLQLEGPLQELLRATVSGTPVNGWTAGVLERPLAGGSAQAQLTLLLPLRHPEQAQVRGQVRLDGNDLQLGPDWPRLTRLRGVVHFSEDGFALAGVQARALGGEVRADGGTIAVPGVAAQGAPRLRLQGTLTAAGLRQETQLDGLARLAWRMSGSTGYSLEFALSQGLPEILLQSSLQGLALDLPAPLKKSAETVLPLRLQLVPLASAPGATARQDQLRLDLGRWLALRYVRDRTQASPRVLRGSLAVGLPAGETLPLPAEGVVAGLSFDELDLDAWQQALAGPDGAADAAAEPAWARWEDYLPSSVMLQGARLTVAGQTFRQLVAGGSREGQTWRANVDARELSGYLEYRMPGAQSAGSVHARLARLALAQEGARDVETLLQEQPIRIPALDVVVQSLELRGKNLGRLEIEAVNRGLARRDAGAREWRLNRLRLSMPEAEFEAQGSWAVFQELSEAPARTAAPRRDAAEPRARGERRRTVMQFRLDIADAGGLLGRLGMPGVLRAGRGRMEGQATWIGSPLGLDYPTLGGNFQINVENGQFLKADPGLAKLLGVLSLQSLPRRLALDFRDVFSEGFAFDYVRGDVQVEQGVASTGNLQMRGVNAAVLMEGRADLARETQDLRVVIVPEINAGTASLIAGWINPAVGLGSFLAQLLLRGPMIAAATQEFRITGSWADPQIARVRQEAPAGATP
ncbi:MAG: YhdP family protein [Hylemonella sp.]